MANEDPSSSDSEVPPDFDARCGRRMLNRIGMALGIAVEQNELSTGVGQGRASDESGDVIDRLFLEATHAGIFLKQTPVGSAREAFSLVRQGFPVILINADSTALVLETTSGRKVEATLIGDKNSHLALSRRQVRAYLTKKPSPITMIAKRELACDAISASPGTRPLGVHNDDDHHHEHPSPVQRFFGLLRFDRKDILVLALFSFVSGTLSLATPLAIESLVNVVSWGIYLQPLVILALMLLVCLGLSGILKVLETLVVEIIQRRQFVRIVGDLAHRFPRANQASLQGEYPRELANRVFDVMTIQKATAVLLLDGLSIILTTVLGLLLLAFYHPFLLGFDIVLLIAMISITWVLGRGGIRTSIQESITKYRVVHWLQDVLASPSTFKINGGESLAIERANRLTTEYIAARQGQFRVVIRQVAFAISLQVLASTALLGLGGWLVIDGQLTLGQLVASELVVTVVVGAFAKAGKSLEKFYDLMAGVDKVGHLLDIPVDRRVDLGTLPDAAGEIQWGDLVFDCASRKSRVPAAKIEPGQRVAIIGEDIAGAGMLAQSLAGLSEPTSGLIQVAGFDANEAARGSKGRLVAYAGDREVFHGSLKENIDLGRAGITQNRVREALQTVSIDADILRLPHGLETSLQTNGYPLNSTQVLQLVLARAVATRPSVLVIDRLLDRVEEETRLVIWNNLTAEDAPWTLVLVTNDEELAGRCDTRVTVRPQSDSTL